MLELCKLKNDTLLLVSSGLKKYILLKLSENKIFTNVKVMSCDEFIRSYDFDYTNKTVYYVMNKYNIKASIARIYIKNLYYLENDDYGIDKLKFLKELRADLLDRGLISENKLFREKVKTKHIVVCGKIDDFCKKIIDSLKAFTDVNYVELSNNCEFNHQIYECADVEAEVNFLVSDICRLLDNNVPIQKIKIANMTGDYQTITRRIFKIFNIPICLNDKNNLYSVNMGSFFLENLASDITITLNKIKESFDLQNENLSIQYNKILSICNSYNWCEDYLSIRELLVYELQHCILNQQNNGGIEIIDLEQYVPADDEYIYLLGFCQGLFPYTEKDEDYLNDNIKEKLHLETTVVKNNKHISDAIRFIKNTKNLVITFPKYINGPTEVSNINDLLKYSIIKKDSNNFNYSNLNNELILGQKLDTYIKYGIKDKYLVDLLNTYPNNDYRSYDNKFSGINVETLREYKNSYLTLSYSSIDAFFHCAFKFYVSNILKLNIYEENFMNYIGSLFHFVLSKCYDVDFNFENAWNDFISNNPKDFSNKEKYFLDKLKKELYFIIGELNEQKKYTNFNELSLEKQINIDKSYKNWKVNFVGIVDKILSMKKNNQELVAVVDYKTGNPSLDLTKVPHGLGMQLPIYLYLINNMNPDAIIVGFYLQKILPTVINRDNKKEYSEQKKEYLKLQGYSVSKEELLCEFDNSYEESKLIKSMRTTSKGFSSYSKVLTDMEINNLKNLVNQNIDKSIEEITNGNYSINPKQISGNLVGCEFCQFKDICFRNNKDIVDLADYKDLSFLRGDENA